ncbi:MAG: hypothetical protein MJ252_11935 [archaeon]|nr:hypothetical protein [archaeon]
MVKPIREKKAHSKYSEELFPALPEPSPNVFKKCYFQKINDYHDYIYDMHQRMVHDNMLIKSGGNNNESKSALSKQFFENISNNKLLGVTITKEGYMAMRNASLNKRKTSNDFLKSNKSLWMRNELKKINSVRQRELNLQRDINYVTCLNP